MGPLLLSACPTLFLCNVARGPVSGAALYLRISEGDDRSDFGSGRRKRIMGPESGITSRVFKPAAVVRGTAGEGSRSRMSPGMRRGDEEGSTVDHRTREYYDLRAAELACRYDKARGGVAERFDRAFPRGGRVLDVGAGSGRDLNRLLLGGWDGWGVEPCRALIGEAERLYPAVRGRIRQSVLPDLDGIGDGAFDGVLCSAVLMHLADGELERSFTGIRRVLRDGGTFLVSLPLDGEGRPFRGRDDDGRLFNGLSPEGLERGLAKRGFASLGRWENGDGLGRDDRRWALGLFRLSRRGDGAVFPPEAASDRQSLPPDGVPPGRGRVRR